MPGFPLLYLSFHGSHPKNPASCEPRKKERKEIKELWAVISRSERSSGQRPRHQATPGCYRSVKGQGLAQRNSVNMDQTRTGVASKHFVRPASDCSTESQKWSSFFSLSGPTKKYKNKTRQEKILELISVPFLLSVVLVCLTHKTCSYRHTSCGQALAQQREKGIVTPTRQARRRRNDFLFVIHLLGNNKLAKINSLCETRPVCSPVNA